MCYLKMHTNLMLLTYLQTQHLLLVYNNQQMHINQ